VATMNKIYDQYGWFNFALVHARPEFCCDVIQHLWVNQKSRPNRKPLTLREGSTDVTPLLNELHSFKSLHHRNPVYRKHLMLTEAPGGHGKVTMLTSNSQDGSNALIHRLSEKIESDITIFLGDKLKKFPNPMNYFWVINDFNTKRIVRSMRDPAWGFFQSGTPLWFENEKYYERKYIKDRMNIDIIEEYIKSIGIGSFDESTWIDSASRSMYLTDE
jgi:hypothetical protein